MRVYLDTCKLSQIDFGDTFVTGEAVYIKTFPKDWSDIETGDLAGAGSYTLTPGWCPVVNLDTGDLILMDMDTQVHNRRFVIIPEEEML